MIEYMLAKIICREFDNVVYKGQYKSVDTPTTKDRGILVKPKSFLF